MKNCPHFIELTSDEIKGVIGGTVGAALMVSAGVASGLSIYLGKNSMPFFIGTGLYSVTGATAACIKSGTIKGFGGSFAEKTAHGLMFSASLVATYKFLGIKASNSIMPFLSEKK